MQDIKKYVHEILLAGVFLTRLPFPVPKSVPTALHTRSLTWFPIIGAMIGVIGSLVYGICFLLGLPALVCALVTLSALILTTGALHEDGLADTVDGLCGGTTPEHKRLIMQDSRIGTFGVLALILSTGLRISVLSVLSDWWTVVLVLIVLGMVSRMVVVVAMYCATAVKDHGLATRFHTPARHRICIALTITITITMLLLGVKISIGLLSIVFMAVGSILCVSSRQIGGYTGDILGAIQVVSECIGFLFLAAVL